MGKKYPYNTIDEGDTPDTWNKGDKKPQTTKAFGQHDEASLVEEIKHATDLFNAALKQAHSRGLMATIDVNRPSRLTRNTGEPPFITIQLIKTLL